MKNSIVSTGEKPGSGCYRCTNCGQNVNLSEKDKMPPCPNCSNTTFKECSNN